MSAWPVLHNHIQLKETLQSLHSGLISKAMEKLPNLMDGGVSSAVQITQSSIMGGGGGQAQAAVPASKSLNDAVLRVECQRQEDLRPFRPKHQTCCLPASSQRAGSSHVLPFTSLSFPLPTSHHPVFFSAFHCAGDQIRAS